ncbi:MAG: zinc-ribbon domain-containing protein [Methanobrevibacter woesei]|nr:zinc-ribbon domain-containing protein [Methanobrevibacter woesei]
MVKYCPKCGAEIKREDAKFCDKCGKSLRVKKVNNSKEKSTNKRKMVIVAVLILIVAVAGFICYELFFAEHLKTVDIDVASFSCNDDLNFSLNGTGEGFVRYQDQSDSYLVKVWDFSQTGFSYEEGLSLANEVIQDCPSYYVDGILIYNSTANVGEHVGDARFITLIEDSSKNMQAQISTPTPEDTVLIAKSFEFLA